MSGSHFDPGVRAVVFDAVGTLIVPDPPVVAAYRNCGLRHGLRLDDGDVRRRFRAALSAEEAIDRAAGWRTDAAREEERWRNIVVATLGDGAFFRELWDYFTDPASWALGPAVPLLHEALALGLTVGVASNFDARLRGVLASVGGLPPVARVTISAEVGWRKPARAFFDAVVPACGCERGDILYVGDDRANDYDAALAAGLRARLI